MVLIIFTCTFFACSNQKINSEKPDTLIIVDGIGNDWEKYNLTFDEDLNIVFGALNTDSTIYLMFRFNDQVLARKFALRGLTLWLDEEKQTGINYRDENLHFFPGRPRKDKKIIKQAYSPNGAFKLIKKDSLIDPSLDDYPNLKASFSLNDGLYCFEFMLPLNNNSPMSITPQDNEITIGIELAELSQDIRKQMKEKMKPQRPPGGMGGGQRGGMPGGMGGMQGRRKGGQRPAGAPNPHGQQVDFSGKEIWFDVILEK